MYKLKFLIHTTGPVLWFILVDTVEYFSCSLDMGKKSFNIVSFKLSSVLKRYILLEGKCIPTFPDAIYNNAKLCNMYNVYNYEIYNISTNVSNGKKILHFFVTLVMLPICFHPEQLIEMLLAI